MKVKCKLFGHTHYRDFTDSGYQICSKCGAHEYYDNNEISNQWNEGAILVRWFWNLRRWIYDKRCSLMSWIRVNILKKEDLPF